MLSSLLKHREALLGAVIVLMVVAIGSRVPSFIAPGNLVEMFNDTAILIVLALGQMMVLLTKGIDLSMAANLALTGMIVALINFHYPDVPVWALLILASALGLLMGALHRRRERHGSVLHRDQRRENAVHQLLPFRSAGRVLRLPVDLALCRCVC